MSSLDSPLFTAPQAASSQAIDSFATEIQSAKVLLPARFPFSTTAPKIDPQTDLHVETRVLIPSVFGPMYLCFVILWRGFTAPFSMMSSTPSGSAAMSE
jgi:hypothetical protein